MTPNQFERRILIVVSGMSPQVLTETLFALACGPEPEFTPTEIHLLSTMEGARHARLNLLEGNAHFLRMCDDYGLDRGVFGAGNIHAIARGDGTKLDDIRSPADNEAAADFITDFIREHTMDDASAVHVSMAGGRKTMGYYAGYALSLYGRDQDRLSHVLVADGFENHKDFYYPTPVSRAIYRDGKTALDAKEARVELASIPFVRMRDELPDKALTGNALLDGRKGFSEAIAMAEFARRPHVMTLDLPNLQFRVDEQLLEGLGAADLSFLCWLASREAKGLPPLRMREDIDVEKGGAGEATGRDYAEFCIRLEARDEYLLDRSAGGGYRLPELRKSISSLEKRGFTRRTEFESRLSRLVNALGESLGKRLAGQFAPRNIGARGAAAFGFADFDAHFIVVPLD